LDLDDGYAQAIRPVFGALREDADLGPRRVAARMAGTAFDLGFVDPVEEKDDLGVRELLDPVEAARLELRRELDAGADGVPILGLRFVARGAHGPDRLQGNHRSPLASAVRRATSVKYSRAALCAASLRRRDGPAKPSRSST